MVAADGAPGVGVSVKRRAERTERASSLIRVKQEPEEDMRSGGADDRKAPGPQQHPAQQCGPEAAAKAATPARRTRRKPATTKPAHGNDVAVAARASGKDVLHGDAGSLPGCSPRTPSPASVLRSAGTAGGEQQQQQQQQMKKQQRRQQQQRPGQADEAESGLAGLQISQDERLQGQHQRLQQQLLKLQQQLQLEEQEPGLLASGSVEEAAAHFEQELQAQTQQLQAQLRQLQKQLNEEWQAVLPVKPEPEDRGCSGSKPGLAAASAAAATAEREESPLACLAGLAALAAAAAGESGDALEDAAAAQHSGSSFSRGQQQLPRQYWHQVKSPSGQQDQQKRLSGGEEGGAPEPSAATDEEADRAWQQQQQAEQQQRQQFLAKRLQQQLEKHAATSAATTAAAAAAAAAANAAEAALDPAGRGLQQAQQCDEACQAFWRQQQLLAQRQRKRQHLSRGVLQHPQPGLRKRAAAACIRRAALRNWQRRLVLLQQMQQGAVPAADGSALADLQQQLQAEQQQLQEQLQELQAQLLQQQEQDEQQQQQQEEEGEEEEAAAAAAGLGPVDEWLPATPDEQGRREEAWDVFEEESDALAAHAMRMNRRKLRRSRRLMTAGIRKALPLWSHRGGGGRGNRGGGGGGSRGGAMPASSGSLGLGSSRRARVMRVGRPLWADMCKRLPRGAAKLLAGALAGTAALEAAGLAAPGAAAGVAVAAGLLPPSAVAQEQQAATALPQQQKQQQQLPCLTAAEGLAGRQAQPGCSSSSQPPRPGWSGVSAQASEADQPGSPERKGRHLFRDRTGKFCRLAEEGTSSSSRNRNKRFRLRHL